LVALDLCQCLEELESFDEDPTIPYRKAVLPVRARVQRVVQELQLLVDLPPAAEIWSPLREVSRLWLPEEFSGPLHRLGAAAGECSAESPPGGRLVDDGTWASGAGVACDLGFLSLVLNRAAESCEGDLGPHLASWALELRHQSESLIACLPQEPEEQQEVTRTEVSVPRAWNA